MPVWLSRKIVALVDELLRVLPLPWNRLDRLAVAIYQRRHPDHPWLNDTANSILASMLKPSDVGLEFGSGRSTIWFARRLAKLTSVEHDPQWYEDTSRRLRSEGITNVDYRLAPRPARPEDWPISSYVRVADEFPKQSLDFILIDGPGDGRDACVLKVLDLLKPGGLLVVDDLHWWIPCTTGTPQSRTAEQGPASELWAQFLNLTKDWRRIWTTDRTHDTAFFIKPCQ
jgi:SAM-dependent methyltransferase